MTRTAEPSGPGNSTLHAPETAARRVRFSDVLRLLVTWAISFLALLLTAQLLSGFTYTSWWPLLAAAAVTGLVGMIVRPVLVEVSAAIGWIAVAAATPVRAGDHHADRPRRRAGGGVRLVLDGDGGGLDGRLPSGRCSSGSSAPAPTSRSPRACCGSSRESWRTPRWTASCSSSWTGCRSRSCSGCCSPAPCRRCAGGSTAAATPPTSGLVQLPCTTPASQQAILQGSADGVPAFRWYDRELGRVLVANRPEDASIIESRASTGQGLLADDGVSISNLFTGDAPRAAMTMSRLEVVRGSRRTRAGLRAVPASPRRAGPQLLPHPRARSPGSGSRRSGSGVWPCTPGCTARGPSPGCAPSATASSATSTPSS